MIWLKIKHDKKKEEFQQDNNNNAKVFLHIKKFYCWVNFLKLSN